MKLIYRGSVTGTVMRLPSIDNLPGTLRPSQGKIAQPPSEEARVQLEQSLASIEARVMACLLTDALDQECVLITERTMKDYDYFHSQNREQSLPGYANITAIQRGSVLTLWSNVYPNDKVHFDRRDYDCDAQFKTDVEQWASRNNHH